MCIRGLKVDRIDGGCLCLIDFSLLTNQKRRKNKKIGQIGVRKKVHKFMIHNCISELATCKVLYR